MLPVLVTIGNGLAWFAATVGQLFVWGAGIGLGYWAVNKLTKVIDYKLAQRAMKKSETVNASGQVTAPIIS